MYAAASHALAVASGLATLEAVAWAFLWIALGAWLTTGVGVPDVQARDPEHRRPGVVAWVGRDHRGKPDRQQVNDVGVSELPPDVTW
jgi:hypothetical protein